uniref:G2/mitotic-specific cyclin-B3 isoform X1 n=1 Tax=Geotrypetes seraphini TaxID=260995 RepID=A0A6P8QUM5_GEOSA|nr:G2/mitotic-specific cyclin-B3 isoform X1 [Geotrypetes seraphini]XP_033801926.1 G2/mitotic-specific cyclin-B3 isoform X1 [Geotrypetes seraphini]XP_033801927.1 G2/mitotic-specific cyclin-B3 isoform X1 [Geotrypetes seraphini]XP_033801928.1 G2/mitotic-specific cyclin-B3 isoform X1 [Geotrypetes seraphini]XP_033801929.1 G2/mitotic-specific cyclin-B3 isoform X1 [Geotrypetes seraphini]XP_033801930.1 G2/mitotic-specific cyclin-B3 isoform X1 [Geotrypetes seraphini]
MPVMKNSRGAAGKLPRPGKAIVPVENVKSETEESSQAKRSPSSPQGGPKKRSAFGDITNARKNAAVQPGKKKDTGKAGPKRPQKSCTANVVAKSDEASLKKLQNKPSVEDVTGGTKVKPVQRGRPVEEEKAPPEPALEINDIDKENLNDPFASAEYAVEIFSYMKEREEKFLIPDYMEEKQKDISKTMRSVLVDWMVEVQENFELNHETLYLAVKLVDHYLVLTSCMREKLQLIGSTAILISSKFEERCPPCVDDFLYICDDAYKREELIDTERDILQTLKFDINIPVSYRFLRRYAKCNRASMETLTLARFICELTLQEYEYVQESASKLAASCLLLALKMKRLGGWTPTLAYYSGYEAIELHSLVKRLNFLVTYWPDKNLKAVRSKYSHKVFFEVAKIAPLDMLQLDEELKRDVERR